MIGRWSTNFVNAPKMFVFSVKQKFNPFDTRPQNSNTEATRNKEKLGYKNVPEF